MHLHSHNIVVILIAIVGMAVLAIATPKPAAPVTVQVVNMAETKDTARVTVEFLSHDAAARFAEAHQLQVRTAGRWQPPVALPKSEDGYLLARTNRQQLVFDLPRQTEACRFSLGYRVGPRPYCRAYFFLSRHGVSKLFPAVSKAILKCVPQQPRLRRVECQLEIPAGTHDTSRETSRRPDLPLHAGLAITGMVGPVYSVEYVTDLAPTNNPSAWRCLEFLQPPASPNP